MTAWFDSVFMDDRDRLNAIEQHKLKVYHFNAPPIAWTCVRNNRCFDAPTLRKAIDDAMRESNTIVSQPGGKAPPAVTPPDDAAR